MSNNIVIDNLETNLQWRSKINQKFAESVSVQDYGAVGDGVTDDTAAIQEALDSAASNIIFPKGNYKLISSTYDATADWRHHLIIPDDKKLTFEGGRILTDTPFATRSIAILIRGSNVVIDGLETLDELGSGNPFSIGVGMGSKYDSSFPAGTKSNIEVRNCSFNNNWIGASFQMATDAIDGGGRLIDSIRVLNCTGSALVGNTSSGIFDFRSDTIHKISDVNISNCSAYDGKTASSFNFYGIDGFSANNCTSYRNDYAGMECENGSQNGVISSFRSVDDFYGLWIDDSRRISVSGMTHKTIRESITGILGTASRFRPVLKITREGFTDHTTWKTEGIVSNGIVSEFGTINIGTFGGTPAGDFGWITINSFCLYGDGTTRASGNKGVVVGGDCPQLLLTDGLIVGLPDTSIELSIPSGGVHKLNNIITEKAASEASDGITAIGAGKLKVNDVSVQSDAITSTSFDSKEYRVNDVLQPERISSRQQFYAGIGSPEGAAAAGIGSLFLNSTGGASTTLYIKESGTGNTGWVAK